MSQADPDDDVLSPEAEAALLGAIEAALRPQPLDPQLNERLLERLLEDPFAPASAEELVESARLRDALAEGSPHESAALLGALRAPFANVDAPTLDLERAPPSERGKVVYVWFGAASALLAAAAAVLLFVTQPRRSPASAAVDVGGFVKPHTTADLFDGRFETKSTSSRVDLIASVRGRDLRDNRYAAWGVR